MPPSQRVVDQYSSPDLTFLALRAQQLGAQGHLEDPIEPFSEARRLERRELLTNS